MPDKASYELQELPLSPSLPGPRAMHGDCAARFLKWNGSGRSECGWGHVRDGVDNLLAIFCHRRFHQCIGEWVSGSNGPRHRDCSYALLVFDGCAGRDVPGERLLG